MSFSEYIKDTHPDPDSLLVLNGFTGKVGIDIDQLDPLVKAYVKSLKDEIDFVKWIIGEFNLDVEKRMTDDDAQSLIDEYKELMIKDK